MSFLASSLNPNCFSASAKRSYETGTTLNTRMCVMIQGLTFSNLHISSLHLCKIFLLHRNVLFIDIYG